MTTTAELTATLATALGLPRRLAEETARHLREDRMLSAPESLVSTEHAVTLLLGLMAAPTTADAPDCAGGGSGAVRERKSGSPEAAIS